MNLSNAVIGMGLGYKAGQDEITRQDSQADADKLNALKISEATRKDKSDAQVAADKQAQLDYFKQSTAALTNAKAAQTADTPSNASNFASDIQSGLNKPVVGDPYGLATVQPPAQALPQGQVSTPDDIMPDPNAVPVASGGLGSLIKNPNITPVSNDSSNQPTGLASAKGFLSATNPAQAAVAPAPIDDSDSAIYHSAALMAKQKGDLNNYQYYSQKFLDERAKERAIEASDAQVKLQGGDPSGFVKLYNGSVHDGKNIVGEVGTEVGLGGDRVHVFKLSDGNTIKMPEANLQSRIAEYGKPGSELGAYTDALKDKYLTEQKIRLESAKIGAEINRDNVTGKTAANQADARQSDASAANSYALSGKTRQETEQAARLDAANRDAALDPNIPENVPKIAAAKRVQEQLIRNNPEIFHANVIEGEDGEKYIAVTGNKTGTTQFTPAPKNKAGGNQNNVAVVNTLPAGSKQIGTSNGKPVYQTPDGKQFIGN